MSFHTISAILRGNWLIDPAFAQSQLPIVLEMVKGNASRDQAAVFKDRMEHKPKAYLPTKMNYAGVNSNLYSVSPFTSMDRVPYNSIAMVNVLGPVLKYGDYCTYGSVEYNDLMIRLANSDRVNGILLNVDSPGGQADGTGMLAETIRQTTKVKPVISVVQDGMAASAGIWIYSAAQECYVTRATDQVGSIGAYTTMYDFKGYFEQNGVKVYDIYAPQSTDKNKDYRQVIESDGKETTLISADLQMLVEDFKKSIKTFRGPRLKVNGDEPFTGKMYTAKEALKLGLIDGIKPITGVVSRLEELIKLRA